MRQSAGLILAGCVLAHAGAACADEVEQEEQLLLEQVVAELRLSDPNAALSFEAGQQATSRGAFLEAMEHFERAAELAPTSSHPRRATCQTLVAQKRKEDAVSECEKAIDLQKSHENATALAQTLATPPYSPEQLARALELSALAVRHGTLADLVARCSVLITAEQVEASQTCTETLRLRAPNSKVAYTLSALSSASASELSEAYAYLERARSLGADAEEIDAVEELVEVRTPLSQRVQRWTRNLLVGWFGLGIVVSAMTSVMANPSGTCMGMARMFSGMSTSRLYFRMK